MGFLIDSGGRQARFLLIMLENTQRDPRLFLVYIDISSSIATSFPHLLLPANTFKEPNTYIHTAAAPSSNAPSTPPPCPQTHLHSP